MNMKRNGESPGPEETKPEPEVKEPEAKEEKSFDTPKTPPVEEEDLTLDDLLVRYVVTVSDIGKTAKDLVVEIETDGVDDKTKLTEKEMDLLDAILFSPFAQMEFRIAKMIINLRSISSEVSIASERLMVELVGERKLTQQELVIIDSRMQLARYLLSYGEHNFNVEAYETQDELLVRYKFVSTLPVSVLDHCNDLVRRFVGMQTKVLKIKTLTNF